MRAWQTCSILVACVALLNLGPSACLPEHERAFSNEGLLTAAAGDLKATVVTPHLEAPLAHSTNVLWCGTFQLVWNEICTLVGGDLHFTDDPPMVEPMNRKAFTREDLDEASYVALAGYVRDGIFDAIPKALQEKFGRRATPHYLPPPNVTPRPQDIVGYAYLFKHLEFAVPFERLDERLDFSGLALPAFGLGPYKRSQDRILPQVLILDYVGPDDFIIELATKSKGDRLILAKVAPGATLGKTVADVQKRADAPARTAAVPGDRLAAPLLNFDITRTYDELYAAGTLVATNPDIAKDLWVLSAIQNVRFQMDERGVRLRSESHLALGCSAHTEPQPQHVMIFNRPFLILLKRVGARDPYFALWIDNAELLVREAE